jgi:hypothetical protein
MEWDGGYKMKQSREQGVQGDEKRGTGIRLFNKITQSLEALNDLPMPNLLVETLLLRPNSITVLTTREIEPWLKSYKTWLQKSCRSKVFDGCTDTPVKPIPVHSSLYTPSKGASVVLEADVCPANAMAFGATCPSDLQSVKRYLLHNFMTTIIVPPSRLILEDIARSMSTEGFCKTIKKSLENASHQTVSSEISNNIPSSYNEANEKSSSFFSIFQRISSFASSGSSSALKSNHKDAVERRATHQCSALLGSGSSSSSSSSGSGDSDGMTSNVPTVLYHLRSGLEISESLECVAGELYMKANAKAPKKKRRGKFNNDFKERNKD